MTTTPAQQPPLIYLVAGEASGDLLGGQLMQALKEKLGGRVRFAGVGGSRMTEEGLKSLFPMRELSLMGFVEIIPHIPKLLRRIRQTANDAKRVRPDVVITIDSPDFNFRVGRRLAGSGIPLIHYVGPSVWAYRAGRAADIARFLDHLLVLFPFEPPYFESVGLPTTFIGHPLVEANLDQADAASLLAEESVPADAEILTVLPGSRTGEISRHLALFGDAVHLLAKQHPRLTVLVPAAPGIADLIRQGTASWSVPVRILEGVDRKYAAFAASRAALAVSGTVTLELAIAGVPMVVAYRANPLTVAIARRIVRTPYISLGNLVLGEAVAPELIQEQASAQELAKAIDQLMVDGPERRRQLDAWHNFSDRLTASGKNPSQRAADVVIQLITNRNRDPQGDTAND